MSNPPNWASDANFPAGSDPWSATPTKVAPSGGQIAAGVAPRAKLPAQWFNYILQAIYTAVVEKVIGPGSATDNGVVRVDGTTGKMVQDSHTTIDDSGDVRINNGGNLFLNDGNGTVSLAGTGTFDYTGGRAQTTFVAMTHFKIGSFTIDDSGIVTISSNFGSIFGEIGQILPDGAVVTAIKVVVNPGTARSGSNRMIVIARHRTTTFGASPSIGGSTAVGTDTRDDTTTNLQTISLGTISETIDKSNGKGLWVTITGGSDAGTNADTVHGLQISWTDPGPRNH